MGEAKKRRLREREDALRVLDQWAVAPSTGEKAALAAIQSLPVVRVERVPPAQIAYMRTRERLCHDNCVWYEKNDPSGNSKAVTGWLVDQTTGNYVLHAVIRSSSGEYRCITPTPHVSLQQFDFIPDPAIVTTRDEDGYYRHVREGYVLGVGIRPDPAKTIARIRTARARIMAGDDLLDVMHSLSAP